MCVSSCILHSGFLLAAPSAITVSHAGPNQLHHTRFDWLPAHVCGVFMQQLICHACMMLDMYTVWVLRQHLFLLIVAICQHQTTLSNTTADWLFLQPQSALLSRYCNMCVSSTLQGTCLLIIHQICLPRPHSDIGQPKRKPQPAADIDSASKGAASAGTETGGTTQPSDSTLPCGVQPARADGSQIVPPTGRVAGDVLGRLNGRMLLWQTKAWLGCFACAMGRGAGPCMDQSPCFMTFALYYWACERRSMASSCKTKGHHTCFEFSKINNPTYLCWVLALKGRLTACCYASQSCKTSSIPPSPHSHPLTQNSHPPIFKQVLNLVRAACSIAG